MKNILKIWKNEFITMLKDPGSLLIMVIGVFMYSLFYTIPFANQILRDVPIGVVDFDNSSLSRELIRDLDSNEFIKIASRPIDVNEAKTEFYANKIRAYIVIPEDFEKDIFRGGNSYIASFEDSAYLIVYKQVSTGILTTASSLGAKLEIGKFMKKGFSKQQAMSVKLPFEFIQIPLYNPAGSYENYIYPLVLILILQQTMLVGAGLLGGTVRERLNNGVSKAFCEYSNNPVEIVLGKSMAYISLYLFYSIFCFLIYPSLFVYEMTYNIGLLYLLLIPFFLSVAFLAQALVYFYTERENSLLILVVTSLPMIFLPGFVWPKESMPLWLIAGSKFIPATATMDGLTRVNQMGAVFHQVQGDFWVLVGLCVLYFALACKVTKKFCK
ncbi:MAG: ABC transporter permease [Candidatus Gastranaerophilaceae bacterium]